MPRTGLNRHRRGYATKEAGSVVHFPVSGPIGLTRSHFLYHISLPLSHFNRGSIILNSRVSKALDFYRNYCTKQSIRSYHNNYQGIIKDWINQTYHMHFRRGSGLGASRDYGECFPSVDLAGAALQWALHGELRGGGHGDCGWAYLRPNCPIERACEQQWVVAKL